MSDVLPNLETMNLTELLTIYRRQTGLVVKRSVERERLIQLVEGRVVLDPSELAGTTETRKELETFVTKNWVWINSQIPCQGTNRGKCTLYPCPEARHLDCYLAAKKLSI